MLDRSERLQILNRLEKGEITPEEALRLLAAQGGSASLPQTPMGILEQLDRGEISPEEAAQRLSSPPLAPPKQSVNPPKVEIIQDKPLSPKRTESWWLVLIAAGTLLAVLAGLWMSADLRDGIGIGFFCAWVPLSVGVLLLLFGWFARRGPWAKINFKSHRANGHVRFDVDMPVPLGVAGKALHFVGDRVPALGREDVDRLLTALEQASKDGESISIRADSNDGDDSVDIKIS